MDVCFVIEQRPKSLNWNNGDIAASSQVTESYISQLLTRKEALRRRTQDLYEKMTAFLKLPKGQLSAMVEAQRREELKKKLGVPAGATLLRSAQIDGPGNVEDRQNGWKCARS